MRKLSFNKLFWEIKLIKMCWMQTDFYMQLIEVGHTGEYDGQHFTF